MVARRQLKGDLLYMKIVKVKVCYNANDNSIDVKFDENAFVLLSKNEKTLYAKKIYNMFDYKNDKTYELEELEDLSDLDEDNAYYIKECYKIFKNIIDGISVSENKENITSN